MTVKKIRVREVGTFGHHNGDGFIRTVDGAAWQYMLMPNQPPVRDAAVWETREQAARPMFSILQNLADLVPRIPLGGRKANRAFYREIHILAVSASRAYEPSRTLDPDNRTRLAAEYPDLIEHERFTLFGVRLTTEGRKRSKRETLHDIWERLTADSDYDPDDAFDADRERIMTILQDAGCTIPSDNTMRTAFAWWPTDRKPERLPVLVEHEHMHTFPDYRRAKMAAYVRDVSVDCSTWADSIKGSYPLTIITLGALPFEGENERYAEGVDWASTLLAAADGGGQGALAVSVRGLVEPGQLSRDQIDKDKQKVVEKAIEQAASGYKQNLNVAEDIQLASDVYGRDGKPWPTLVEGRVHVALPRIVDAVGHIPYAGAVSLNVDRQFQAWHDMQIGSYVEYNPTPVFWPAPILAYAGLNGRAFTGDDTGRGRASDLPGALVGVTEADRQPVYDSPYAASARHGKPITLCLGSTGSGKTRLGLHLAAQYARLPNPDDPSHTLPVVFWDPKPKSSDFEPFVTSHGGQVYRLDTDRAVGILDPFRCIPRHMPDMILQTSVSMLSQITGGRYHDRNREMALASIVGYGLRHDADCLGDSLRMAQDALHGRRPEGETVSPLVDEIQPILDRAVLNDPLLRLIYGVDAGGPRLSVADGLTLLSAGSLNVIPDDETDSAPSDVQRWVCRMAAMGASSLIIGRNGMFVGDEAWSLLLDDFGRSFVNRMGRLARDQHYGVFLLSQKADEFVKAGIEDFVGKVYVMAIGAKNEGAGRDSQAQAACRLAGQPLDGRMHARMMHDKVVDPDSRMPDYMSLYALTDPNTGRLLRGSIAYLAMGDAGPAIPIEIRIAQSLR